MTDSRMHVLVAGAGVAGLETALALEAIAREYVTVELIAPERDFTYRPLAVAEPFQGEPGRQVHEGIVSGGLIGRDVDLKVARHDLGNELGGVTEDGYRDRLA